MGKNKNKLKDYHKGIVVFKNDEQKTDFLRKLESGRLSPEDCEQLIKIGTKGLGGKQIMCSHQKYDKNKRKWELAIVVDDNTSIATCKLCKQRFAVAPLYAKELNQSAKVISDAINQIKMFSDNPGRKEEQDTIEKLGRLAQNIEETVDLYTSVLANKGKKGNKKKNKNKNRDYSYGSYGLDSMVGNRRR